MKGTHSAFKRAYRRTAISSLVILSGAYWLTSEFLEWAQRWEAVIPASIFWVFVWKLIYLIAEAEESQAFYERERQTRNFKPKP